MKKIAALLLCLVMLGSTAVFAEETGLTLGTLGNSQAAYTVSCTAPNTSPPETCWPFLATALNSHFFV